MPPSGEIVRGGFAGLSVVILAASAVVGGNPFGLRERLSGSSAVAPVESRAQEAVGDASDRPEPTMRRSQPWWQSVQTVQGTGAGSLAFTVSDQALQWRISWTCEDGPLGLTSTQSPGLDVDATCPDTATAYGIVVGDVVIDVAADGPWTITVDQQVDAPLHEPPLDAMAEPGASVVATGELHRIDQPAEGRVEVHRLADGSHVLRLDSFFVHPNADLELRLSTLTDVTSTDEFLGAVSTTIAVMDVTAGSINVAIPEGIDPGAYGSLVIWCEPAKSAYAAAPLAWDHPA